MPEPLYLAPRHRHTSSEHEPVGLGWRWIGPSGPGTVQLAGELDMASAPELLQTLDEALDFERTVVLDLRRLDFIDVAGMRAILSASQSARRSNRLIVVVRGPRHIDAVFRLTGVDQLLDMVTLAPSAPARQAVVSAAGDGEQSTTAHARYRAQALASSASGLCGPLRSERWVTRPDRYARVFGRSARG